MGIKGRIVKKILGKASDDSLLLKDFFGSQQTHLEISEVEQPTLHEVHQSGKEKSLAFSNRKVQIASFTAEIAEKSPENRRKNRRKIAAIFWGCRIKIAAFPRFQNRSVFGTLGGPKTT